MEKLFNWFTIAIALWGGFAIQLLGGMDEMLHLLISLVVVDFITGMAKGVYTKELSSKTGFKGIVKKVAIFIVVAVAVEVENFLGASIPLRAITIMFYVANEGLSFVENIGTILPLPPQIKNVFIQIRDKESE